MSTLVSISLKNKGNSSGKSLTLLSLTRLIKTWQKSKNKILSQLVHSKWTAPYANLFVFQFEGFSYSSETFYPIFCVVQNRKW